MQCKGEKDGARMKNAKSLRLAPGAQSGRSPGALAAFVLPLALAVLPGSPAAAACVQSGSTVSCDGASVTGFGTGTENNLTVTVQPGASITPPNSVSAIKLGAGNTATNNGTITLGFVSFGMQGQVNNTLTNNGLI